jgi:hypothetical protein
MLSTINNSVISYQERKSSWCLVSINDVKRRVKIVHIGRGKFKVISDGEGDIYADNIIIDRIYSIAKAKKWFFAFPPSKSLIIDTNANATIAMKHITINVYYFYCAQYFVSSFSQCKIFFIVLFLSLLFYHFVPQY